MFEILFTALMIVIGFTLMAKAQYTYNGGFF